MTDNQVDINDLVLELTSEDESTIFLTDATTFFRMLCYSSQDKQAVLYDRDNEEFLASDLSDEALDDVLDELVMGRYYRR